jgi:hypothetical protein
MAALWRASPDGAFSFTMLVVNADCHRMYAPGNEKRPRIVPRAQ